MQTLLPAVEIASETVQSSLTFPEVYKLFPEKTDSIFLEIGFGTGTHLAHQAKQYPQAGIIGCETYIHSIGDLLVSIKDEGLANIRIFSDDARFLIEKLPDACLDKVFIFYPDPWPKTRHHKRRLISKAFLAMLSRVMKQGAEIRLATDDADYCAWILEHLMAHKDFVWQARCAADWKNPPTGWVRTRYEAKALDAGRVPTYLFFKRI